MLHRAHWASAHCHCASGLEDPVSILLGVGRRRRFECIWLCGRLRPTAFECRRCRVRSDKKTYSKDKLVGSALRRKARLELQLSALNVSSLASTRALTRSHRTLRCLRPSTRRTSDSGLSDGSGSKGPPDPMRLRRQGPRNLPKLKTMEKTTHPAQLQGQVRGSAESCILPNYSTPEILGQCLPLHFSMSTMGSTKSTAVIIQYHSPQTHRM